MEYILSFALSAETTKETLSMPEGVYSTLTPCFSQISSIFLSAPICELMPALETVMMEKFLRPAMPVMKRSSISSSGKLSIMSVPGWSGSFVLRMLSGMFFSLTGKTAPSCSTCAPM